MTYSKKTEFDADYYKVEMNHVGESPHVTSEMAFLLYTNVFGSKTKGLGFQIFGRHVYRPERRGQIGIAEDEIVNLNPLLTANWSIPINDTWLLAGVNSMQEFHAASPITFDNILDAEYIVTVTGRELVGLALAGYKEHKDAKLGRVYQPYSTGMAEGLTLPKYDEVVKNLTDHGKVLKFLREQGQFDIYVP
jgi:hypothetical protein